MDERLSPSPLAQFLHAALRWRTRVLLRSLPARHRRVFGCVPLLMHAGFHHPSVRSEPPGCVGFKERRSWGRRAAAAALPPPAWLRRDRPLVASIALVPSGDALRLAVFSPAQTPVERRLVQQRLRDLNLLLSGQRPTLVFELHDAHAPMDGAWVTALQLRGGWVMGEPPAELLRPSAPERFEAAFVAQLLEATGPVWERYLVALLLGAPGHLWPEAVEAARQEGSARSLAIAEETLARCARAAHGERHAELLQRARAASDPGQRPMELAALLPLAQSLAGATRRAMHRARVDPWRVAPLRAALETGPGMPRPMEDVLRRASRAEKTARLEALERGVHRVVTQEGAELGRGHTAEQALVRALAVEHLLRLQLRWELRGRRFLRLLPWLRLQASAEVSQPGEWLAWTEGEVDPIAVRLVPGRRPVARTQPARTLVTQGLEDVLRGLEVQLAPSFTPPEWAGLRLGLEAVQKPSPSDCPWALQWEARTYSAGAGRLQSRRADSYLRRPRRARLYSKTRWIPPPEGDLKVGRSRLLECECVHAGPERAQLRYRDAEGYLLEEDVPLDDLFPYWEEGIRLVRQAGVPDVPFARGDWGRRRYAVHYDAAPCALRLELTEQRRVGVWMGEVRYGPPGGLPWAAAAETILSGWPVGAQGALRFEGVQWRCEDVPVSALGVLYLRSFALRKLKAHIRRLCRP